MFSGGFKVASFLNLCAKKYLDTLNPLNLHLIRTVKNISAVCDKLDQNKSMFKKRYYRQDCRLEFQSYTKVILKTILKFLMLEISLNFDKLLRTFIK